MQRAFMILVLGALLSACAGTTPSAPDTASAPAPATPSTGDTAALPRITLAGAPTHGNRAAPVALVVFADYQCPYCARFHHGMLGELKMKYIDDGTLLYVHKDFPLPTHAQALPAAVAARCAGAQGRYGAMQGRLYEAQTKLGELLYAELARTIGLDIAEFDRCRADASVRRAIGRDLREGKQVGVAATPTLMLGRVEGNTVVIERVAAGLPSLDTLSQEIERLRAPAR